MLFGLLQCSLDSLRSSSAKVGSQTVNNYFLSSFLNYFPQTGNNYFLPWGVCVNSPYAILGPNLLFFCNKILPPVPDIQYSSKAMWGQPCGKGTQAWSNPFLSEFCVLDLEVLFVLKLSSFQLIYDSARHWTNCATEVLFQGCNDLLPIKKVEDFFFKDLVLWECEGQPDPWLKTSDYANVGGLELGQLMIFVAVHPHANTDKYKYRYKTNRNTTPFMNRLIVHRCQAASPSPKLGHFVPKIITTMNT